MELYKAVSVKDELPIRIKGQDRTDFYWVLTADNARISARYNYVQEGWFARGSDFAMAPNNVTYWLKPITVEAEFEKWWKEYYKPEHTYQSELPEHIEIRDIFNSILAHRLPIKRERVEKTVGFWHEGKELSRVTLEDAKKILSHICFKGGAKWLIKDESEVLKEPCKTIYSNENIYSFTFYNDDITMACEDDRPNHNTFHAKYDCFVRAHELGYYIPMLSEAIVKHETAIIKTLNNE